MQKKIIAAVLTILAGGLFLFSCTYDTLVPEGINPNTPVSFSTDIQPIFTQNCVKCHGGTTNPDLREGKSYASLTTGNYINTASPAESVLYVEMAPNGGMSSYSNASQAQLVLLWIQQGAKNN
jgi:hypothetical protein